MDREEQIKILIKMRENGWWACFHKAFRVGDYTKDGKAERLIYDIIAEDLHLYPMLRDKAEKISSEDFCKFFVNFIYSVGNDAVIDTFSRALTYTKDDMETEE